MTIDFAAKRYGVLPSQLLREGDTLDLECANVAVAYETYCRDNPEQAKVNKHGLTQDQMRSQLESVREENRRRKEHGAQNA